MSGQRGQRLPSECKLSMQKTRAGWSSCRGRSFCQHLSSSNAPLALIGWVKTGLSRDSGWQPSRELYSDWGFPNFIWNDLYVQFHIKEMKQRGDVSKAARWQGQAALSSRGTILRDQQDVEGSFLFSSKMGVVVRANRKGSPFSWRTLPRGISCRWILPWSGGLPW